MFTMYQDIIREMEDGTQMFCQYCDYINCCEKCRYYNGEIAATGFIYHNEFIDIDCVSFAKKISENDIILAFFDNGKVIFEKHYTSWKSVNIAYGKLKNKYRYLF